MDEESDEKARALDELKDQFQDGLDGTSILTAALDSDVQALLQHQQRTAAAFVDYENRVLALELQGLVDRWRTMDIDELSQQNHELREECLRLQRENMELSKAVAESSLSARRDLAKIEMALEMTVKTKMKEMHDKVRQELYEELDEKTKRMVSDHGALQDYVRLQAANASSLDRQYRKLQADRTRLKMDADVATSLSEQQALQAVGLRRQLQEAYQAVDLLRRRLAESEARGQAAWDEAVRASSRAAVTAAAAARAGLRAGPGPEREAALAEADADSAYGMAGEGAELAALEAQLRHSKQRFERMRLQRDRWRDRALLFERATAQLQAALQTLQDASRCGGGGPAEGPGTRQDMDLIWCAAKAAAAVGGPGGGGDGASRPSTAQTASAAAAGGEHGGGDGGEKGGRATDGGGVSVAGWLAGAMKARSESARPLGGYGTAAAAAAAAHGGAAAAPAAAGLPARPHTALPLMTGGGGGGGGRMRRGSSTAAARRTAEAIRASVGGGSTSPLLTQQSPPLSDTEGGGGGTTGGGIASSTDPGSLISAEDAGTGSGGVPAEGTDRVRAPSPPGRVHVSRLYNSSEAEPYRVVRQVQYDRPGWPETTLLRPTSPNRPTGDVAAPVFTTGGSPVPYLPPAASPPPPLSAPLVPSALTAAAPGARRLPGSVRPHSAVHLTPPQSSFPRWTAGRSLTGLTTCSSVALPAPTEGSGDGGGGGGAATAAGTADPRQPSPSRAHTQQVAGADGSRGGAGQPPTVQQVAVAEWQSWLVQRERAQSLEPDEVARATAAAAAAAGIPTANAPPPSAAGGGGAALAPAPAAGSGATEVDLAPLLNRTLYGSRGGSAGSGDHGLAALSPSRGSGPVPELGTGGGALHTLVHATTAAAVAAAAPCPVAVGPGALRSLPSLPSVGSEGSAGSAGGGRLASQGQLGHVPAAAGSGQVAPPAAVTAPSAMLAALRRPPTAFKRLGSADVLFAGARATTARGSRALRTSSAATGGSVGGGAGGGGGGGDGGYSLSPTLSGV